jgi:hypothetical protein
MFQAFAGLVVASTAAVHTNMQPLIQPQRRWRWATGVGVCLVASGACAEAVLESADSVRLHGSRPMATAGVLDRALIVDTNTSQRNLDLLLDARRAGDVISPMRAAVLPAQPPALPTAQSRSTLVPLGLQSQDSVTAPGAAERREWVGGAPGRTQSGLPGGSTSTGNADVDPSQPRRPGHGADEGERLPILVWMDELRQFMRENRIELLVGVALLLASAAALQSLARRR